MTHIASPYATPTQRQHVFPSPHPSGGSWVAIANMQPQRRGKIFPPRRSGRPGDRACCNIRAPAYVIEQTTASIAGIGTRLQLGTVARDGPAWRDSSTSLRTSAAGTQPTRRPTLCAEGRRGKQAPWPSEQLAWGVSPERDNWRGPPFAQRVAVQVLHGAIYVRLAGVEGRTRASPGTRSSPAAHEPGAD